MVETVIVYLLLRVFSFILSFCFQLINDRGVGGKCYGFVTYTNPRSAVDAISDMDGRVFAVFIMC